MFLAGLKFALDLVVGLTLISGVAMLGIIGAELFDRWRKKHRRLQWEAKAPRCVAPRHSSANVLYFAFAFAQTTGCR